MSGALPEIKLPLLPLNPSEIKVTASTFTATFAVKPSYVAWTTDVPADTPVITPAASTAATAGLLLDQATWTPLMTVLF